MENTYSLPHTHSHYRRMLHEKRELVFIFLNKQAKSIYWKTRDEVVKH